MGVNFHSLCKVLLLAYLFPFTFSTESWDAMCDNDMFATVQICMNVVYNIHENYYQESTEGFVPQYCSDIIAKNNAAGLKICDMIWNDFKDQTGKLRFAFSNELSTKHVCVKYLNRRVLLTSTGRGKQQKHFNNCLFRSNHGVTCLFLHGMGQLGPIEGIYRSTMSSYWGASITKARAENCEPVAFWVESQVRGWWDDGLQAAYCKAISETKPQIVFTHSMGNLIVAAGILRGIPGCVDIASGDVKWFGIQGPNKGTDPASWMVEKDICNSKISSLGHRILKIMYCVSGELINSIVSLASSVNFKSYRDPTTMPRPSIDCPADGKSLDYTAISAKQITPTSRNCTRISDAVASHMSGNMCGTTCNLKTWALLSNGNLLGIGCNFAPYGFSHNDTTEAFFDSHQKEPGWHGNDGMVLMHSCSVGRRAEFTQETTSPFYAVSMNHAEGTGLNGDRTSPAEKPVEWIQKRIETTKPHLQDFSSRIANIGEIASYAFSTMLKAFPKVSPDFVTFASESLPAETLTSDEAVTMRQANTNFDKAAKQVVDVCSVAVKACCDLLKAKGAPICDRNSPVCTSLPEFSACHAAENDFISTYIRKSGGGGATSGKGTPFFLETFTHMLINMDRATEEHQKIHGVHWTSLPLASPARTARARSAARGKRSALQPQSLVTPKTVH